MPNTICRTFSLWMEEGRRGELAELSLGAAKPSSEVRIAMVTFTGHGRADQVQIFLPLRLNCKLLLMPSDATSSQPMRASREASLPPFSGAAEPPGTAGHTLLYLNLIDLIPHFSGINISSEISWVPNTQTGNPSMYSQSLHFFTFPYRYLFS